MDTKRCRSRREKDFEHLQAMLVPRPVNNFHNFDIFHIISHEPEPIPLLSSLPSSSLMLPFSVLGVSKHQCHLSLFQAHILFYLVSVQFLSVYPCLCHVFYLLHDSYFCSLSSIITSSSLTPFSMFHHVPSNLKCPRPGPNPACDFWSDASPHHAIPGLIQPCDCRVSAFLFSTIARANCQQFVFGHHHTCFLFPCQGTKAEGGVPCAACRLENVTFHEIHGASRNVFHNFEPQHEPHLCCFSPWVYWSRFWRSCTLFLESSTRNWLFQMVLIHQRAKLCNATCQQEIANCQQLVQRQKFYAVTRFHSDHEAATVWFL